MVRDTQSIKSFEERLVRVGAQQRPNLNLGLSGVELLDLTTGNNREAVDGTKPRVAALRGYPGLTANHEPATL